MNATALICDATQTITLQDVTIDDPGPDQVAIRTHYSGVSIGTEFALIRNKISWGPYPLCTGYMGSGVIEAVGKSISDFAVGEKVYFRGNNTGTMKLLDTTRISCVSGGHCSHIVADPHTSHGVAKLPDGIAMDVAAMFVMPAVGLNGVDMVNPRLGQTVVVYGCGLIGLGVIAACATRGCKIIAVDMDAKRLVIAREMGADILIDARIQDVDDEVRKISHEGAEVVFECTGLPHCIDRAIALCHPHGSFVWQGNYGAAPITMQFLPAHGRQLQMFFPCDDGLQPCRQAVIKNMAMGTLKWDKTITHRITFQEAPEIYARIAKGETDILGVVIRWSE